MARIRLPHGDLAAHARWVAETIAAPFTVPTRLPLLTKAPPPEPEPPQPTLLDLLDAMGPRPIEAAPAVEDECPACAEPGIWRLLRGVIAPPSPLALKRQRLKVERATIPLLTMDMGRFRDAHGQDRCEPGPDGYVVTLPPFHLHDQESVEPVDELLGQVVGVAEARALLFRRMDPDVLDGVEVGSRYVLLRFWDDEEGQVWSMPVEGEEDADVRRAIQATTALYRGHRTTSNRAA